MSIYDGISLNSLDHSLVISSSLLKVDLSGPSVVSLRLEPNANNMIMRPAVIRYLHGICWIGDVDTGVLCSLGRLGVARLSSCLSSPHSEEGLELPNAGSVEEAAGMFDVFEW